MSLFLVYLFVTIILFTLFIKHLFDFYTIVKLYPPGPLPIPVLGNLLKLIWKRNVHPFVAIHEECLSYGKVSTFWLGSKPAVIINDLDIGRDAYNQLNCSGRPPSSFELVVSGESFKSFVAQDYSNSVHLHRKVSLDAVRQILSSEKLSSLVNEIVSETITIIKSREKNNEFSPDLYYPQIPLRILAELIFGQKYSADDKSLKLIEHTFHTLNTELTKLMLIDFLPVSKYFIRTDRIKSQFSKLALLYKTIFENCKQSYETGNVDSIVNSLLTARLKMLEEDKDSLKHLSDNDILGIISALFFAGTDSSIQTFNWLIIIMAHYTELQQKLRNEISDKIGNDICPQLEDRKNCHYVNAFIHEVLRFRTTATIGAPHTTLNDIVISNYKLPKDTLIFLNQHQILHDPLYWKDPEKFIPERFLDSSDLFVANRFPAFIPFSIGKRICIGDRMAVEMLFLEVVCLLQATNGYQFELPNGPQNGDLDVWSYPTIAPQPKPYKIVLKQKGISE